MPSTRLCARKFELLRNDTSFLQEPFAHLQTTKVRSRRLRTRNFMFLPQLQNFVGGMTQRVTKY